MIKYCSTQNRGSQISFKEAVLGNLPDDGGLYFPTEIPAMSKELKEAIPTMSLPAIAGEVLHSYCAENIDKVTLDAIAKRVFDFPMPLSKVSDDIRCLELFHGPTFAFKDIGAKFLAECLAHFNADSNRETTVLVATSGDTGGAVANGFFGVEGVKVVILYPKGKVSLLQEKQLTTLGGNITALEVEGTFDDCQNLVKKAFADKYLRQKLKLSSANSINIARWLPQSLFYFVPLQQGLKNITVSVPSGNYGNLTAGVLAMKTGVPISRFIAASNANDVVPRYLKSGTYRPKDTIPTIANAMDVADPSNFKRLLTLFDLNYEAITEKLVPFTLNDNEIEQAIKECYEANKYLADPHSVIAYQALEAQKTRGGIFLGTAHYCKFIPTMQEALGQEVAIPDFASGLMQKEKKAIAMEAEYNSFKDFLLG